MKKTILLLFCIISVISLTACSDAESPISDFAYTVDGDQITIDKYLGNDEAVVIPKKIENCQVVSTALGSFNASSLKEVTIPDTLVSIGTSTFMNCRNLTNVAFGNEIIEIQSSAFAGCSALQKVILPPKTQILGNEVFLDCTSVKEIYIPKTVTTWGTLCFSGNTSLISVTFEDGLKKIGGFSFVGATALETLTIPASVDEIGYGAFGECPLLKSVTFLGDAPTTIAEIAFGEPNKNLTIYYNPNTSGWDTTPLRDWYTVVELKNDGTT